MSALLAQQVPNDVAGWLTGSAASSLAFVVLALIRGWLVPGRTHDRVLAENDDLKAEARGLQGVFLEKVIPALTRATDLIARSADQQRSH